MASEQVEREDKYDAPTDFQMPDLSVLVPDGAVEPHTHRLEATYYDTTGDDLRRNRITLRHRTGGSDAGWHLKLPEQDGRTEIGVVSSAGTPPGELSSLLLGVRLGRRLVRRATLTTTRRSRILLDGDHRALAEVSDDFVHAQLLDGARPPSEWRELEVELTSGADDSILQQVGGLLISAGARPAAHASKYGRAVEPPLVRPLRNDLGGLVDRYLNEQYDAIFAGDLGLRREHNLIHPTRVAIRRLRSTLRVFRDLFDAERLESLERELVWYAGLLGAVRDIDVQTKLLTEQLARLNGASDISPMEAEMTAKLGAERDTALRKVRSTLGGKRYLALLKTIDGWRSETPFTTPAQRPPEEVGRYVDQAEQALDKRLRQAAKRRTDDELFHRARKAAKRFRYANELAAPVLGAQADRAVDRTKDLQTLLGEHQDSVVSDALLRRMAADSEHGFVYGVLAAEQQQVTKRTRAAVIEGWLNAE